MRHYVYNSALRDAAVAQLQREGERLRVLCVGDDPRQRAVLASAGDVRVIAEAAQASTEQADVVLCTLADAPVFASRPCEAALLCVAGMESELTPRNLGALATLEADGFELVSHQIAPADNKQNWEHVFVLVRAAAPDTQAARLKRALVFDAHALQSRAVREIERYNAWAAQDAQLDPDVADRTHEVTPFPTAGATAQIGAYQQDDGGYTSTEEIVFDPALLAGRALSIHLDGRLLADWAAHARRLAGMLAMPEHVELVLAPPVGAALDTIDAALAPLRDAGVATCVTSSPPVTPWNDVFLAHTAPEALVVAYYGGPRAPVTQGWDWDVLRAAQNMPGAVFALKASPNKTRYISTGADALRAAEGFPIVSRAWLEACGRWSRGKLAPHLFQALVAYQFDSVDWMNKHRKLRLAALATVRTEALNGGSSDQDAFNVAPAIGAPVETDVREAARRIALMLHAVDWAAEQNIAEPTLTFSADVKRLKLLASGGDGRTARWALAHQPFRLPL